MRELYQFKNIYKDKIISMLLLCIVSKKYKNKANRKYKIIDKIIYFFCALKFVLC